MCPLTGTAAARAAPGSVARVAPTPAVVGPLGLAVVAGVGHPAGLAVLAGAGHLATVAVVGWLAALMQPCRHRRSRENGPQT